MRAEVVERKRILQVFGQGRGQGGIDVEHFDGGLFELLLGHVLAVAVKVAVVGQGVDGGARAAAELGLVPHKTRNLSGTGAVELTDGELVEVHHRRGKGGRNRSGGNTDEQAGINTEDGAHCCAGVAASELGSEVL